MKRIIMKKHLLLTTLLTLALAGGALGTAFAAPGGGRGPGSGHEGGRFLQRMAVVLNLSADQQNRIEAILASERQTTQPLQQALRDSREKLRAATAAGGFDEAAVRTLAASQAQTRTELIVARARTQNQIYNVLTPEQRARAEKLRALRHDRRGGGQGRRGPAPDQGNQDL